MHAVQSASLFKNQLLSGDSGFASELTSETIRASGNALVVSATLINGTALTSSRKLIVRPEASYDGHAWFKLGATAVEFEDVNVRESDSGLFSDLDAPFIRLRASLETPGAGVVALFDATIVISQQA